MLEEPGARLGAERIQIQRFPEAEGLGRADKVDAADEAADPLEHFGLLEVRRAPAAARIDGKVELAAVEEGVVVEEKRGDDRDFATGELERESVLLEDLLARPAAGPVELDDDRRAFVQIHLVDAVLVAVQREKPPVRTQAGVRARIEDRFGREPGIRMSHAV